MPISELRQAVATLAGYVASDEMDVPEPVRQAAPVYARACRQVNERLVAYDHLLRDHHLSEALRQAELEPDVLSLYADLDFSGRDRWEEIATAVGLDVPPRLNATAARRLHQAFARHEPIEDLLRQHRRMALTRAPLRRRLDVLRLLARADPSNRGWADDVRSYEAARFEEIRADIARPDSRSWEEVKQLNDELASPEWAMPPPLDVLGAVQNLYAEARRRQGELIAGPLCGKLAQAVRDGDLDEARGLEERIWAVAKEYGIPERSPVLAALHQAGQWIGEEIRRRKEDRKFNRAIAQLWWALTEGADWWYVQEYYRVARSFDRPIPADLGERFAARSFNRRVFQTASAVAVALAVLVGAVISLIKI